MDNTVVGVYDSYAQAQNVMTELLACGFSRDEVQLSPESDNSSTTGTTTTTTSQDSGSGIGHFFRSLFGMNDDERDHEVYSEAVRRGSCVVTVNAESDEKRERAVEVMNRFDPIDLDQRSSQWASEGWTGYRGSDSTYATGGMNEDRSNTAGMNRPMDSMSTGTAAGTMNLSGTDMNRSADMNSTTGMNRTTDTTTGDTTRIPIVEEELRVGKRVVQRGGVRIYQRMTERPVQESVQLREEHVKVERHAVDQPATEADMAAFKEGSIELRETAEEAVVSKSARVVEEVVVGKEVTQQTENINDTVRRTEVDVEQLGATSGTTQRGDYMDSAMTSDDSDFRTHWQNAYGQSGGRYEDYDTAYRYGSTMAGSDRYKNYRWEDAETNMRSDWERDHPESAWDKVKDAVRYGAERVSGRGRH